MNVEFDPNSIRALREAYARSPEVVKSEANKFLSRGIAEYNKVLLRNPWTTTSKGGGIPVDTMNLRDTHQRAIETWQAWIRPTADYAIYVHEGTKKMSPRPWLEYAKEKADKEIIVLQNQMLESIANRL